jgi:hypothetical protein
MEIRDQIIENQDVLLDGNTFTGCTFRNCRLIFRATAPIQLSANHFKENVQWFLDGPAGMTLKFLASMYHGGGEGGRDLVENTFEQIRRGGQ